MSRTNYKFNTVQIRIRRLHAMAKTIQTTYFRLRIQLQLLFVSELQSRLKDLEEINNNMLKLGHVHVDVDFFN